MASNSTELWIPDFNGSTYWRCFKQLPGITSPKEYLHPPDFTSGKRPSAAAWCKRQLTMGNSKGTIAHSRLKLTIIDLDAGRLSGPEFLAIICDGGLDVAIAIDISDHRRRRRWQLLRIDPLAQR